MKINPPPPLNKPWEDVTPDDILIGIEEGPAGEIDMSDEPWWKRFWYKLLRIT